MAKKAKNWTEHSVFEKLEKVFPSPAHTLLSQVRNGTGFARRKNRTADAVAVSVHPSRGLWLAGIEIKVSRNDWMKELSDPDKSAEIQRFCKYWYVAAPQGLIQSGEVPETWGLIEIDRTARVTKPAPKLTAADPDMLLLASILRNSAEATVPIQAVNKRVQSALDEQRMQLSDPSRLPLENLIEKVKAFEKSSGLHIANYNADQIGEAVRLVLRMNCEPVIEQTKRLRNQHQVFADQLTRLVELAEGGTRV